MGKRAQVETLIFVLDFFLICSVMKKNLWKKFFKSFRALQSFVSLMAALTFDRKFFAFEKFVQKAGLSDVWRSSLSVLIGK